MIYFQMRRNRTVLLWVLVTAVIGLTVPAGAWSGPTAGLPFIDITNPFLKKIPLAIPVFNTVPEDANSRQQATESTAVMSNALEFTSYFKILDQAAFLVNPGQGGATASQVNFGNWTAIGAELLITGVMLLKGDQVEMEFRLFDTFKGQMAVGKRYRGPLTQRRQMILRFCSEVVYYLTGSRGIFDSEIAFVSSTGKGNSEVFVSEFDGYNPQAFTSTQNITLTPAWSWDGQWLAYVAYGKTGPNLYMKHRHEKRVAVFDQRGTKMSPAWVPGRFELSASLSLNDIPQIYLLTGDGKMIKRLTDTTAIDVTPSWSPDGRQMAFVSTRSGSPQVYVLDTASGQVRRLTFEGNYNQEPCWSPKGDRIAYTGMEKGGRLNIYVTDVNGERTVKLTHDEGDNESPSWSPDGSLIAFSSTREGPSRIYVMTASGTDQRRLLSLPGEQKTPSWSPSRPNSSD
jgi:TolB protein